MLALKKNQGNLYEDISLYLNGGEIKKRIRESGNYSRTEKKARGQIEIREFYQTEEIGWLSRKSEWKGLRSIGMEEKSIVTKKGVRKEYRYYISSLKNEKELFRKIVRWHWSVENI